MNYIGSDPKEQSTSQFVRDRLGMKKTKFMTKVTEQSLKSPKTLLITCVWENQKLSRRVTILTYPSQLTRVMKRK